MNDDRVTGLVKALGKATEDVRKLTEEKTHALRRFNELEHRHKVLRANVPVFLEHQRELCVSRLADCADSVAQALLEADARGLTSDGIMKVVAWLGEQVKNTPLVKP